MSTPWETLGVSKGASEEEIRKAFKDKARKLHPDKGGSASEFRELYDAYNELRDKKHSSSEDDTEDEWYIWLSRWAKRFIGTKDDGVLKIKVPIKLLEDRTQSINIEYDGIPVKVDLSKTETIVFGGLRVRIIPHAFIMKNDSEEECKVDVEPWRMDDKWLFDVPKNTIKFKINGGEWSSDEGEYKYGVYWRRLNSK